MSDIWKRSIEFKKKVDDRAKASRARLSGYNSTPVESDNVYSMYYNKKAKLQKAGALIFYKIRNFISPHDIDDPIIAMIEDVPFEFFVSEVEIPKERTGFITLKLKKLED